MTRETPVDQEVGSPLLPEEQLGPFREASSDWASNDEIETQTGSTEMEGAETEKAKTEEIQMEVVRSENLPEKFRPQAGGAPTIEEMPRPIADIVREATASLNGPEREAFLCRLKEEHPELFSGKTGGEVPPEDSQGQFSKERWRDVLVRLLKEEANRFMAAAVSL